MSEWKETEIGRIPKDWELIKANELCNKVTDGTHDTPKQKKEGVYLITSKHINNGKIDFTNAYKISIHDFNLINKRSKVDKWDILFSMIGTVGEVALIEDKNIEFSIKNVGLFKCEYELKAKWLYYYFNSSSAKYHLNSRLSGTTQKYITLEELRHFPVPVPGNNKEQRQIIDILSCIDKKIELLRRQNETLEKIAQAIFKRWFVDFEFPNEAGKPYKSSGGKMVPSELGEIPRGWKEKPIFELGSFINGAAFKPSELNDKKEGLPVIKIVELKYGITDKTKWSEKRINKDIVIKDKDVLFSWSGNPETSIDVFIWSGGAGKLNQHTFKIVPKSNIEISWLFFLIKHLKPFFIHLAKQKQTTGLGHVTITDLKENKFVVPSPQIMDYFSETISPLFDKMFSNSIQIKVLTKTRDGLLPKLMSGKIRVKT